MIDFLWTFSVTNVRFVTVTGVGVGETGVGVGETGVGVGETGVGVGETGVGVGETGVATLTITVVVAVA